LVVIGATGSGKSASCKSITGLKSDEVFKASGSLASMTYETKGTLVNWFGDKTKEQLFVIDTPGLGDSKGRDM
jgi:predicted GTPase